MNKLPIDQRVAILRALTEGCSLRSISRMVGVSINTVTKLLDGIVGDVCVGCDKLGQGIGEAFFMTPGALQLPPNHLWQELCAPRVFGGDAVVKHVLRCVRCGQRCLATDYEIDQGLLNIRFPICQPTDPVE